MRKTFMLAFSLCASLVCTAQSLEDVHANALNDFKRTLKKADKFVFIRWRGSLDTLYKFVDTDKVLKTSDEYFELYKKAAETDQLFLANTYNDSLYASIFIKECFPSIEKYVEKTNLRKDISEGTRQILKDYALDFKHERKMVSIDETLFYKFKDNPNYQSVKLNLLPYLEK